MVQSQLYSVWCVGWRVIFLALVLRNNFHLLPSYHSCHTSTSGCLTLCVITWHGTGNPRNQSSETGIIS